MTLASLRPYQSYQKKKIRCHTTQFRGIKTKVIFTLLQVLTRRGWNRYVLNLFILLFHCGVTNKFKMIAINFNTFTKSKQNG